MRFGYRYCGSDAIAPAFLAAGIAMALGIVAGGYGRLTALVRLGNDELDFTILRGAHNPAIWILGGVWLATGIRSLFNNKSGDG